MLWAKNPNLSRLIFWISLICVVLVLVRTRLSFYRSVPIPIPNTIGSYPNRPAETILHFDHPSDLTNVELFFSENPPQIILLETVNAGEQEWKLSQKIEDNHLAFLNIVLPSSSVSKNISALRVTFPQSEGNTGIPEIRTYSNPPPSPIDRILSHIFIVKREPLSYIYYIFIIIFSTLLVGYSFGNLRNKVIDPFILAVCWGKGIGTISILGLLKVYLLPDKDFRLVLFALVFIGLIRLLHFHPKFSKATAIIIIVVLIYISNALSFFYFKDQYDVNVTPFFDRNYDFSSYYPTPYGAYETDFLLPYGVTKTWNYALGSNDNQASHMMAGYRPSDRTPLLSLYSIPFLKLFGDRFFVFEMVSIAILPTFLIGTWLLLERIFSRKVAYLSVIILSLNQWLFFAGHFSQVRLLALYFISLFLFFTLKNFKLKSSADSRFASVWGSLAFLSHPFSLVYIFPVAAYHLYNFIRQPKKYKILNICWIYSLPLIIFIGWILWSKTFSGNSLLVSSMTSGTWEKTSTSMNSTAGISFGDLTDIIRAKFDNLIGIFIADPRSSVIRSGGPFRTTFPLALSVSLLPFITISLIHLRSKTIKFVIGYSLIVIFLTTFIFLSFYAILGLNWYHLGLIPLFIGVGTSFIRKLRGWLQITIVIFAMAEFYYVTWIYFPYEAGNSLHRLLETNREIALVLALLLLIEAGILSIIIHGTRKD